MKLRLIVKTRNKNLAQRLRGRTREKLSPGERPWTPRQVNISKGATLRLPKSRPTIRYSPRDLVPAGGSEVVTFVIDVAKIASATAVAQGLITWLSKKGVRQKSKAEIFINRRKVKLEEGAVAEIIQEIIDAKSETQ